MTGLLLRYSPEEATIRSVGDQPNGIVSVCVHPAHCGFAIDAASEPPPPTDGVQIDVRGRSVEDGLPGFLTPLGVAEAVEASDGVETLQCLWQALSTSLVTAAEAMTKEPRMAATVESLAGVARGFVECVGAAP